MWELADQLENCVTEPADGQVNMTGRHRGLKLGDDQSCYKILHKCSFVGVNDS